MLTRRVVKLNCYTIMFKHQLDMSVSCEVTSESHRIMLNLHGIMSILCVVMLNCHADIFKRQLDMSILKDVTSESHPIMLKMNVIMSTCRVVKLNY